MRVVVHDYVGYAFPAQLARALARRGHDVLFLHCSSFVAGKGLVEASEGRSRDSRVRLRRARRVVREVRRPAADSPRAGDGQRARAPGHRLPRRRRPVFERAAHRPARVAAGGAHARWPVRLLAAGRDQCGGAPRARSALASRRRRRRAGGRGPRAAAAAGERRGRRHLERLRAAAATLGSRRKRAPP